MEASSERCLADLFRPLILSFAAYLVRKRLPGTQFIWALAARLVILKGVPFCLIGGEVRSSDSEETSMVRPSIIIGLGMGLPLSSLSSDFSSPVSIPLLPVSESDCRGGGLECAFSEISVSDLSLLGVLGSCVNSFSQ